MSAAKAGRGRAARKPVSVFSNPGEKLFNLDAFSRQYQSLGVSKEAQTILSWSTRIPPREHGQTDTYSLFPSRIGYSHDTSYQNINGNHSQLTVSTQTVFDSPNSRTTQKRWQVETYRLGILSKFNCLPVDASNDDDDDEYSSENSSDIENNNQFDQSNLNESLQFMYDCLESPVGLGSQFSMSVKTKKGGIEKEKKQKDTTKEEVTRIRLIRDPRRPVLNTTKTKSLINNHLLGMTKNTKVMPTFCDPTSSKDEKRGEQKDDSVSNDDEYSRIKESRVKLERVVEKPSTEPEGMARLIENSISASSGQISNQANQKELPKINSESASNQEIENDVPNLFAELKFPQSQCVQNQQKISSNFAVHPTPLHQNMPLSAQPNMPHLNQPNLATIQHLSALQNYHAQQQQLHRQQMHQINLLHGINNVATHQNFPMTINACNNPTALGSYHSYHRQMAAMPRSTVPSPDLSVPNTMPPPLWAHQNLHPRPSANPMTQFPNQQWVNPAPQGHAMFYPANAVNQQNLMFAQSIQNHLSSGSQI